MNNQAKHAKILTGKVVSTKMQKSIVVEVSNIQRHPIYKKPVTKMKKFIVHNDGQDVKVGDTVSIQPIRPISKMKNYKLITNK